MRGFRKAFIREDACEAHNPMRTYTAGYMLCGPTGERSEPYNA